MADILIIGGGLAVGEILRITSPLNVGGHHCVIVNSVNHEIINAETYIPELPLPDFRPEPFKHNQSWQSLNKGRLSKKARRKR